MSGINFVGSYSGIDKSMIDELMKAERLPLNQLSYKKTNITEQQNAWKDINTRLNSLFNKIKTLQETATFTSKAASSTNDKVVTMSAGTGAVEGKYDIFVEQLATNSRLVGIQVEGAKDESGKIDINKSLGIENGQFTIKNHEDESITVDINSGDSLKTIVEKINKGKTEGEDGKSIGVKATIVDGRIVLTDEKTGKRGIELEGSVLEDLGLNQGLIQGQEAKFTINNIEVTKDSNTITDVLEGVTINLHREHGQGESDTVTVGLDREKATKAIQEFVDQYNSTMSFIEDKLAAGDPDTPGSRGTLAADSSLMRLHSSLRSLVTQRMGSGANEGFTDISQLGVSTKDKSGRLEFDTAKLTDALKDNPQKVIDFFAGEKDVKGSGFVSRVNDYIDGFISKENGIIKTKNESYDRTIKDLNRQIDNFNDRMERKEQYYIKMFSALDVAMMQAESQMAWLEGQINAMNGMKK